MEKLINELNGPFLAFLPVIFFILIFAALIANYFFKGNASRSRILHRLTPDLLLVAVIIFRVAYAALLSLLQYYIWSHDAFSKFLLPPYQSIKYFLFYAGYHFWLSTLIAFFLAFAFWLSLFIASLFRKNLFVDGELKLALLASMIVGWPDFIAFLPLIFALAVIYSLLNFFWLKKETIHLGGVFILSALIAAFLGPLLISLSGLADLQV